MRYVVISLATIGLLLGLYLTLLTLWLVPRGLQARPQSNAPHVPGRLIGPETILILGLAAAVGVGGNVALIRRAWNGWSGGPSLLCSVIATVELLVAALWGMWLLSSILMHWDWTWTWNRERTLMFLSIVAFLGAKGLLTVTAEVHSYVSARLASQPQGDESASDGGVAQRPQLKKPEIRKVLAPANSAESLQFLRCGSDERDNARFFALTFACRYVVQPLPARDARPRVS